MKKILIVSAIIIIFVVAPISYMAYEFYTLEGIKDELAMDLMLFTELYEKGELGNVTDDGIAVDIFYLFIDANELKIYKNKLLSGENIEPLFNCIVDYSETGNLTSNCFARIQMNICALNGDINGTDFYSTMINGKKEPTPWIKYHPE